MKSNSKIFKGKFDPNYHKQKGQINLKCICLIETKTSMIITSYKSFNGIKINIMIDKKEKKIKAIRKSKIDPKIKIKNYKYFSLFLGFLKLKDQRYLIFSKKVQMVQFLSETPKIFQIKEIKAISMQNWETEKHISMCLTIIYQKGFYFSYDFDMTRPLSNSAIESFKLKRNPFWLFYTNYSMHRPLFHERTCEWLIPVIFGHVSMSVLNFSNVGAKGVYCIVQRSSIFDLMGKHLSYCNVDFLTVSNSFHQFDLIISVQDLRCAVSVCVNNIPEDVGGEKKAERFFYFIKEKFGVRKFCIYTKKKKGNFYLKSPKAVKDIDVVDVGELEMKEFFKFFKHHILPNVTFGPDSIKVISISSDKDLKFYYEGLGSVMSLFLIFGKNSLFSDEINYDKIKPVLKGIEFEMIKKLKIFENHVSTFKIIRNFFKDETDKKGVLKSFTENIISITNNINESLKDKIMNSCKLIIRILFSYYEKIIVKLINNHKNTDSNVLTREKLKLGFLIHNCSGYKPEYEKDKDKFGYKDHPIVKNSDILVIGLQEILAMKPNNLKLIFLENNYEYKHLWRTFLLELLKDTYEVFFTKNILGLFMLIFVRPEIKYKFNLNIMECDIIRLGALNFANKASIFIKLSINYESINLFNCHLASGTKDKNCEKRVSNIKQILKLQEENEDSILSFIIGDLNFRNKTTAQNAESLISTYQNSDLSSKNTIIKVLLETEELSNILKNEFKNKIKEPKLNFLPSYKFTPKTNNYDFQEGKRVPSHTDRILYMEKDSQNKAIQFGDYLKDDQTAVSDHKPVLLDCEFFAVQFGRESYPAIFDKRYEIIRN